MRGVRCERSSATMPTIAIARITPHATAIHRCSTGVRSISNGSGRNGAGYSAAADDALSIGALQRVAADRLRNLFVVVDQRRFVAAEHDLGHCAAREIAMDRETLRKILLARDLPDDVDVEACLALRFFVHR